MIYLLVVAHPDDEVLGAGASIYKWTRQGDIVDVCIMSSEAKARAFRPDDKELDDDTHAALAFLGVNKEYVGKFPNIEMNTVPHLQLVQHIEKAILESEPDIVITHHPADTNNDHLQTSMACQEAIRLAQRRPGVKLLKEFWYMEVPSCTEWATNSALKLFSPNCYVEVGPEGVQAKIKALSMYRGVMRPYPHPRSDVVSDVHITSLASTDYWEKTLRWYDAAKVDAVMVAGDIADWGLVEQLQNFATAWYKVFPNDTAADGRHVEKVFVCGNHDHEGFTYVWRDKAKRDEAFAKSIVKDRKAAWDLCFHEEFKEIYAKQVKGYTFIGGHWGFHQNIEKFMDEYKSKLDPNLPFFYAQHPHPKDTIYGPWAWGHDNGASTRAFSKTPNAIVFTGHSHYPLTDESGIWQDTFTSIGTASLRYIGHRYNRENSGYGGGPVEQMPRMKDGHSKHGLLVSVFDDHIDVARRDFQNDESLGADWVLPLPLCKEKPYAIPPRAVKARENLPAFAADAGSLIKAEDVDGKDRRGTPTPQTVVTFPTALAGGRAFDYEVQAELNYYDVTRVFCTKRVFAPEYFRTESKLAKEGQIVFARVAEVPEHVDVRFVVTPLDCYGNRGKSIYSKKFKLGEAKK